MTSTTAEPQLAPPGAGLPKFELFVGRLLFAWSRARGTRESATARFQEERERIRQLIAPLSDEDGARRVLIKRVKGLEDSSRYWSVWMVLDHLRIVNGGMTRVIGALTRGIQPPGTASTAAVKPRMDVTREIVSDYEKSCDDLLAVAAGAENLKTAVKYNHPWFGPLDAAGWHAMGPTHLRIHRVQIERIVAGLTDS